MLGRPRSVLVFFYSFILLFFYSFFVSAFSDVTVLVRRMQYAAWIAQYNVTYTPLYNISGNTASTKQPDTVVYPGDPQVNGKS